MHFIKMNNYNKLFQLSYSLIVLLLSYAAGFGLSLILEIPLAKWKSDEKKEKEDSSDKKKAD